MGPPIYRWVGFGGGRARAEFGAIHLLVHRFSRGPDFEHEHEHEEQGTRNDEQARQKIALTVIPPFSLFKSCSCSAKRCSCSCSCSIAIHPKDCRVSLRRNVPPAFSSEKWGHPSIGGSVLEGAEHEQNLGPSICWCTGFRGGRISSTSTSTRNRERGTMNRRDRKSHSP